MLGLWQQQRGLIDLLERCVFLVQRDLIQIAVALIDRQTPLIFFAAFYVGSYASFSYAFMTT